MSLKNSMLYRFFTAGVTYIPREHISGSCLLYYDNKFRLFNIAMTTKPSNHGKETLSLNGADTEEMPFHSITLMLTEEDSKLNII